MNASDKDKEAVILPTDERAAFIGTARGWISRDGRFYGDDERMARWAGSTHSLCECGKVMPREYLKCGACRDKADEERFQSCPAQPWDGTSPVFSDARDEFFTGLDDAESALDVGETLADLRLLICRPIYAVLSLDHFDDIIPTEGCGDVPVELESAIESFNKAVAGVVVSWDPVNVRVALEGGAK
jgi:hypothetical protein